ncbi:PREDICTED: serine-rich adhesin for platelets-like isoform X2 [Dinoponera quadriceps]|uniref:Serine-rich adhesin for platelets-like isoform X2 n=1 Tax=Dinoponera quadriceps TaxID=609295 RepID=A0A6P3WX50_DINQU|nr:PREDICTED: serine-rich adhesin for platelets-like isoform X2 [Dinoponera quadriceps]
MAGVGKRTLLREVNPHLICPLCRGYLIDATTVVECLHSFCRSCILKHLSKAAHCPSCKHALHKAKPNIKADKALQEIVYKMVPGLYHKEMRKRREFYKKHPEQDSATLEQRGEDVSGRLIFAPEDAVSLSLEYISAKTDPLEILNLSTDMDASHSNSTNAGNGSNNDSGNAESNGTDNNNYNNGNNRRYLQCPALVTIAHLKKFLALKYSVDMTRYTIDICHRRAALPENWTLMDVAYIYAWKRIAPMRFFYRVLEEQRLEAPLHQRPSTPGLGACLPPNDAVSVNAKDDDNSNASVDRPATPGSDAKSANDEASMADDEASMANDEASMANGEASTANGEASTVKDKAFTAKDKAFTAKDKAFTAKDEASTVKDETFTAKDQAFTAKDKAFTAKDKAFAVKDEAFTAKDEAFTANDKAFTVKDEAFTAKDEAFTAKDEAFPVKDEAFTAKGEAFTAKDEAFTAKDKASTTKGEAFTAKDEAFTAKDKASTTKESSKITNDKASLRVDNKQTTDSEAIAKDGPSKSKTKTTTNATTSMTTLTTTTMSSTSATGGKATKTSSTTVSSSGSTVTSAMSATMASTVTTTATMTTPATTTTTTSNDTNNKQIKSPIKIMKNSDGRYEVLRSSSSNWNGKEQANVATAPAPDVKPEFSVVSIGNGQNSNGVKITLKQCSPTSGANVKKPKVVSNILLRCGQPLEKDASDALLVQQLQKEKEKELSGQDKQQEKQRRKVTFMDQPMKERTSPSGGGVASVPKTALKKPAEQQDKKQFLQGFQLTARESVPAEDSALKSPVRGIGASGEINHSQKKEKAHPPKKDPTTHSVTDEVKVLLEKCSGTVNTGSSNGDAVASTFAKRLGGALAGKNTRVVATRVSDDADASSRASFSSSGSANGGHSASKMDVYVFHSSDPPAPPAGAVKRKCPPGVPINDMKRRRQHVPAQNQSPRKPAEPPASASLTKLPHIPSSEHLVPASSGPSDYHSSSPSRPVSNAKPPAGQMLSNDTRNLLDGCGLNIPSSLSITLTSPKSPGASGQFEAVDVNDRKAAGKMNPTITLNDCSVDPRVLKALKTGQIKMPKLTKLSVVKPGEQSETTQQQQQHQQQRTPPPAKRSRRDQESILDLSGGKKLDIHPLRIPQPVAKLKANNKASDSSSDGICDQGQMVTVVGGHRYYRAPPGSLTPAAHRVNDCPPLASLSRTPVYAPSLGDIGRPGSNLSSVFPSLQSLYVLSQTQQYQLKMPPLVSRAAESLGCDAGRMNPGGLSGIQGKTSHLAAQCAPVKPARSSVAPLAVPINKHSVDKPAGISIRPVSSDTVKPSLFQRKNDAGDESCVSPRSAMQTRYSSGVESANSRLSSRGNADAKSGNDQTSAMETTSKDSTEARSDSLMTDSSSKQQHDTASPSVSSTASPSPPLGSSNNSRSEDAAVGHCDGNGGKSDSEGGGAATSTAANVATSSSPPKVDTSSCKPPASPDSSSVTVESSKGRATDRASSDGHQPPDPLAQPDGTSGAPGDDKLSANQLADAKQQLTTEVQKRLLAVFPSNEWANNPEAAEHLGNFLKSLNATRKSDGHAEEPKADKIERKSPVANDAGELAAKPKKDVVERS